MITEIGMLKNRSIYLELLKNTEGCYTEDKNDIVFTYEPNQSDLDELSACFDFQKLTGSSELETFVNATNWVTAVLKPKKPYTETSICRENSSGIIKSAADNKYVPNCYAHAVVLNDVFCLLGYKARYIFCLPVDYHITDSHVVNLVYSKTEKRWMLFDAAQNLYYTGEGNKTLDIRELRDCLIGAKPVHIHFLPVIWGNIDMKDQIRCSEKVLTYMAKNMYRFACFADCQRGRLVENGVVDYINLVPTTYLKTPYFHKYYRKDDKVLLFNKYISNADEFWATPE